MPDTPSLTFRSLVMCLAFASEALLAAPAQAQRSQPLMCSAAEEGLWSTSQDSLGLFVSDDAREIGGAVGEVKVPDEGGLLKVLNLVGGYHPVSGYKEMACGQLDHWSVFKLGATERDLHPHVRLSARYRALLDMVPRGDRPDETCEGCLWGEVTVPASFEWFWNHGAKPFSSTLPNGSYGCGTNSEQPGYCEGLTQEMVGGRFCMYGPWVMEQAHGYRAEIHPAQALWGQADGHAYVFFTDDASHRFGDRRDFGQRFLSSNFRPWSGAQKLSAFQVVRVPSGRRASLEWQDDRKSGTRRPTNETGSAAVDVTAPDWAVPKQVSECLAHDGSTQLVFEAEISRPQNSWRGLTVKGSNIGIDFSRTRAASTQKATGTDENDGAWHLAYALQMDRVRPTAMLNRETSSRAWGVLADGTKWTAVPDQEVTFNLVSGSESPQSRPTDLRSEWSFKVTNLEDPEEPVSGASLRIAVDYPRYVATTTTGFAAHQNRVDNDRPFLLTLRVIERGDGPAYRVPNLRVAVTLRLVGASVDETKTVDLYSIAPDFVALLGGYNLRKNAGAFPERLTDMLGSILEREGKCLANAATFRRDLAGAATPAFLPLDLWKVASVRVRAAGILRQSANHALIDGAITKQEFDEFTKAFWAYRQACESEPPARGDGSSYR